jgi:phosphate starvation-inducible PhoH-like protein
VATSVFEVKILVPGHHPMVSLVGQRDELLKLIEGAFGSSILVRGNEITITGPREEAEHVATLFEELIGLLDDGQTLTAHAVEQSIDMVKGAEARPREVLTDAVLVHRGKAIRPKTVGQKKYVDAIRRSTVTFSIGPAGSGKTYLAMATAVRALQQKEVARLILTRPAVEAGEKLGFLPGTLYEKINPYMRPLYDALYDMMDPEQLARLIERGTIEVSPLAFMRGRAQPYGSRVLTPSGFTPMGELNVGDLVIGSDGWPTPVLGVYPQGRREIFRVGTQDGASTLCCGEHLWAVRTASDTRRGTSARVLQTQQMIGRLRSAHHHRYELPLLSGPVAFAPRDVPVDPYALGLLLGDGCLAGSTTPSISIPDRELVAALEEHGGNRGGLIVANPVSETRRELGPVGARSSTRFVPTEYLHNSSDVRLAVLQGLFDTDGGPATRLGGTGVVRYTTTSERLRDDVVFLVRSLGGVAHWRTGRRSRGREAGNRSGAFVMDVRLPPELPPFRLARNAETFAAREAARPMRFITSIEPAGEDETLCISVASQDSLYVTDDFLVTHNTLNDSFIILDEAQNTTPEQMKMFLTRLGFGSKVVVTGDITQVDLPAGSYSGLNVVREILTSIPGLEFVYLTARDVVRHKIVQEIVEAYRRFDESR